MTALIDSSDVELERDRGLVERHQSGDDAAFTQLYAQHYGRLVRYCYRMTRNHHAAEEIAQEAFARAYTALDRLGGERRFYPWLTVIARRLWIDQLRHIGRVESRPEVDTGVARAAEEVAFQRLDGDHLTLAMGRIPERHRQVLRLRDWEGLSYEAIAARMDVPATTVPPLLHRARAGLRKEYVHLSRARVAGFLHLGPTFAAARRARNRVGKWASHLPDPSILAAPMAGAIFGAATLLAPQIAQPDTSVGLALRSWSGGLHVPFGDDAAGGATESFRSRSGESDPASRPRPVVGAGYRLRDAGVKPEDTALRYVMRSDPNTWEARQERRRRMPIYYKHEPTGIYIAADPRPIARLAEGALAP